MPQLNFGEARTCLPTSLGRTFISRESFHPISVYKGIISGEALRLRRLNSNDDNYQVALSNLADKCTRSNFDEKLIKSMLDKIEREDIGQVEALKPRTVKNAKNMVIWATQVPKLRSVPTKYQNLVAGDYKLTTVFTKPNNLQQLLPACRYRRILNPTVNNYTGGTSGCGNCKLCGKRGSKRSMIKETNMTYDSSNTKKLIIRQALNCKDYGIYQLRCRQCILEKRPVTATYVGLTSRKFSERFSSHRSNFKNNITTDNTDKYALAIHYKKQHSNLQSLPELEEAYDLVYVEKPDLRSLKEAEDKWKHLSKATINIQRMITPNIH